MEEALLGCLYQTLDANPQIRQAAEAQLSAAAAQPGYGVALARIALQGSVPFGIRQLSAVVLKQYVKHHWERDSPHFREPQAQEADKATIRTILPEGLQDEMPKIRTAVGMAIAAIAKWDWPEMWPELLPMLINVLRARPSVNAVHGAVRCLSLFAGDIEERVLPELLPVLLPDLLSIASSHGQYGGGVQRRALRILYFCTVSIGTMDRDLATASRNAMLPLLPPWFELFVQLLSHPVDKEDSADWGVKLEVLKILVAVVGSFGKLVADMIPQMMATVWGLFVNSYPVYEACVVSEDGDIDGGEPDSDGENLDFETLISQLFEVILTLVGNPRYAELVAGSLDQLTYYTLGYMQMTRDQGHAWARDPNQYIADEEDDTFSVRVSGEMLLDELIQNYGEAGIEALSKATAARLHEADVAKAAGNPSWWKLREASLLAVGSMGETLEQAREEGMQVNFSIEGLLGTVVAQDLTPGCDSPFLIGRALWVAAKLSSQATAEQQIIFLQAGVAGLAMQNHPPIRIGSCRVVAELCKAVDPQHLQAVATQLYQGVGTLLQSSTEEVLHLILETLHSVIKADPVSAAQYEPLISEAVFKTWSEYANDPLISIDAYDVLGALAAIPECQRNLMGRIAPAICSIVTSAAAQGAQAQPDPQVEGALDILTMILKKAPVDVATTIHCAMMQPLMALMHTSTDPGQLQSGTEVLRLLVRCGGEAMLSWNGADADGTLKAILEVSARLLKPDSGDSAPLYVGGLVNQLVQAMPARMGQALPQVLELVVAKLYHSASSPVITGLLMVFCRLIHTNAKDLLEFLSGRPSPSPAQSNESALAFVLSLWMERHEEINGKLNIKLSTTAIALLLATQHPVLTTIQVRGRRMDTDSGIRTRSRAKSQPEQWSSVPVAVKLVELLSDSLLEVQEQAQAAAAKAVAKSTRVRATEEDEDADDEDDWEDDYQGGKGFGMDLFDFLGEAADDADLYDDEEDKADPIYSVDLVMFIRARLLELLPNNAALRDAVWHHLTASQRSAVQTCLQS